MIWLCILKGSCRQSGWRTLECSWIPTKMIPSLRTFSGKNLSAMFKSSMALLSCGMKGFSVLLSISSRKSPVEQRDTNKMQPTRKIKGRVAMLSPSLPKAIFRRRRNWQQNTDHRWQGFKRCLWHNLRKTYKTGLRCLTELTNAVLSKWMIRPRRNWISTYIFRTLKQVHHCHHHHHWHESPPYIWRWQWWMFDTVRHNKFSAQ